MTEKMKPSGIAAIGEIPASWDIVRIKDIGTYRNGLTYSPEDVTDKEYGTLVLRSSNIQNGKLSFEDNVYVSCDIPEDLYTQKGDIIICSRNGSSQLVGKNALVENDDVNCSFGAFMMVYRCDCPRYMYYVLNSEIFSYYLGTFLTSTINQLTGFNFGNMKIAYCPDPHEQQAISDFLDSQCAKIDGVIADIEKQIEILQKYKKSLITEAVTKGLDRSVPMKESGIVWIGNVPEHWHLKRLKFMLENSSDSMKVGPFGSALSGSDFTDEGKWVYNQRVVLDKNFSENTTFISEEKYREMQGFSVYPGDILITTRGTIGKVAIVPEGAQEGILHPCIIKFRVDKEMMMPELLELIFNESDFVKDQFTLMSNATTIEVIYSYSLKDIILPVIPAEEQKKIYSYLSEKCETIDAVIMEKHKALSAITQHKKSLIYEYVTGKKRVTEVN